MKEREEFEKSYGEYHAPMPKNHKPENPQLFPNTRKNLKQILDRGFPVAECEEEARATQEVIDLCKKIVYDWGNFDAIEEWETWKKRAKNMGRYNFR